MLAEFNKEDLVLQIKAGASAVSAAELTAKPNIAERLLIYFGHLLGLKA